MTDRRMQIAPLVALVLATGALRGQNPVVVEQVSGSRAGLVAVSAVSDKVVWASGGSGAVLRSIDGGATWVARPVPGMPRADFRDIHAFSADVAWLLSIGNGGASTIHRTTDGGVTWVRQFTNADSAAFYDCLTMFDLKHGVAFSDTPADGKLRILRTEDGEHWNLLPADKLPAALPHEGAFASSGGCVVSFGDRNGWIGAGTPASRVFRTTDAGATWVVGDTPLARDGDHIGITGVSFLDAKHGIAVAGNITARNDTTSAAVATSDDGGKSWKLGNRPPAGSLYGVIWVPKVSATTAIGSSLQGLMLTRDAGKSWTALNTNQYWAVAASGKFAWGVGPGGRITRIEF